MLVLPRLATTMIDFGWTGVLLFFVVSGFSLDLTMTKHDRSSRPLLSYAFARFFRIAPLFYLMIPIAIVGDFLADYRPLPGLKDALISASFGFNLAPGHQTGVVWASWTIGVEMIFYAFFPFFYRMPLWVAGVATLAGYAFVTIVLHPAIFGSYTWCLFLGFLPLFVIGMAAHRVYDRLRSTPRPWAPWLFLAACIVLLMMSVEGGSINVLLRLPIALAYAALIVGALLWNPRILANRITSYFGSLSYAIYLVHFPMLLAMRPVYRLLFSGIPPGVAYIAAIPLTFAVLTPLAALANYSVERPFERVRRRLVLGLEARVSSSPSLGLV